ncbi:MAG: leucyl aminopeptidase [Burkholderiaceae bacterium]
MDFKSVALGTAGLAGLGADALMVVVAGTTMPGDVEASVATVLRDAVKSGDLELKAGRCLYVHRPTGLKAQRLIFAVAADDAAKSFKAAVSAGLAAVKGLGVTHLAVAQVGSSRLTESHAEALAMAVSDSVYLYRHTKPTAQAAGRLLKVTLACGKADATAVTVGLRRGAALASGVEVARECANRPANHATPSFLAEQARQLAKMHGFKVQVLDHAAVKKLGMGAFMAVSQGSDEPLKFIVMQYQGAARSESPVVLVGKGITFDTGGISIKPAPEMDEMKFDMSGAASVLGTFKALGELKPRVNVVGLIPACENMPSGRAVKPGDVVRSMSGQTIEILNTDAEGRLILCDALTYAERFKPAAVIDIATLTGACVIALGHHHSGLFSSDDELAEDLLQAAKRGLDPAWRMPLDEEYADALKSNFADMGNVGGRAGGSITAAMFLKKFTARYRWAHLDIAGTAWKSGAGKGATGRPVPLLTHYLLSQAR